MCGIVGILLAPNRADSRRLAAVEAMASSLRHRGPDNDGFWIDRDAGIALGHRRLSIVDLSETGRQPMLSHDENLVMTFNGEVYNFADLRPELDALGHRFRGSSDTEVMLAAFESFGIERALKRFAGMFAVGVWDRKRRTLHLVRDRMGKKPLYLAMVGGALVFASELKAILRFPGFEPKVNAQALSMVLRHGWVPDRLCVWHGVLKLPPGTTLSVRADELGNCDTEQLRGKIRTWWSLAEVAEAGQKNLITSSLPEVEAELDQLLRTVVRERMVADVPLGAFLSGGIDSTTIVALMQAQSSRPVRTFTIGFRETSYDETDHASRVARHFGTHHTEFCLTPTETLAAIPELPKVWDEPFADESQIPTLLLSRLARQHVTVALSGDGGDECFGGYARYFMSARLGSILGLPPMARRMAASALLMLRPGTWDEILRALPLPRGMRPTLRGENLQKCARVLEMADEDHLYEMLTSLGGAPMAADPGEPERYEVPSLPDTVSRLIYRDMASYLPGDILVKLDRATMAASLEARSPFLDHRVVEYSWKLPTALKINDGQGKWLLRRVLQRYLPEDLFERPKQGFNVPIGAWLIGPLREWAQELVDSSRIRREGLLDCNRVQSCWQEHLSGRSDRARELWAVLMVQAWLDEARTLRPPSTPTGRIEAQMEAAGAPASRVSEHIAYG